MRAVNLCWALGLFFGAQCNKPHGPCLSSGDCSGDPGEIKSKSDIKLFKCGELSCSGGIRSTLAAQQEAQCLCFQGRGCLEIIVINNTLNGHRRYDEVIKLRSTSGPRKSQQSEYFHVIIICQGAGNSMWFFINVTCYCFCRLPPLGMGNFTPRREA